MVSGIYCIRNTVSGKVYIGQSVDVARRFRAHRTRLNSGSWTGNLHLQRAWTKDGEASFAFSILEICPPSDLDACELRWIETHDAIRCGYNKRIWASTNRGRTLSEEHKARISTSLQGKKKTAEHAKRVGDSQRGVKRKPLTTEHKEKCSVAIRKALATHQFKGESVSLRELGRRFNVRSETLWKRIKKTGETAEQALFGVLKNKGLVG